jgi:hypothetical protein
MSFADKWSRETIRTAVRRELLDPNERWWSDTELNQYIDDWQSYLQDECEFVWASNTLVTSSATHTLTNFTPSILRLDHCYWNNSRLSPRFKSALAETDLEWREEAAATPYVVWQPDHERMILWPAPSVNGTLVLEYVQDLAFTDDSTLQSVPAWTRYSSINYCCYRAYLRFGPNQDTNRALRRKARFIKQVTDYKSYLKQYFPDRYPSLRPATSYEARILNPKAQGGVTMPVVVSLRHQDEVPTGTINGTNLTFTLTYDPDPDISLKVFLDGVLLTKDTHYTVSTTTITFIEPYQPQTGQTLFATYRYST